MAAVRGASVVVLVVVVVSLLLGTGRIAALTGCSVYTASRFGGNESEWGAGPMHPIGGKTLYLGLGSAEKRLD